MTTTNPKADAAAETRHEVLNGGVGEQCIRCGADRERLDGPCQPRDAAIHQVETRCLNHCGHPLDLVRHGECIFKYEDSRNAAIAVSSRLRWTSN